MYQLGTVIEVHSMDDNHIEAGVVAGHGFVHREHLAWASRNEPYPVLLVEVRRGHDKGTIRVIAPDAVEIRVLSKPQ